MRELTKNFYTKDHYHFLPEFYDLNEPLFFKLVHSDVDNHQHQGGKLSKSLSDFNIAPNTEVTEVLDDVMGSKPNKN